MEALTDLFYELGTLKHIKRSYRTNVLQDTESVAEHAHRASIIAFFLAQRCGVDPYTTTIMALFHDMAETRTGDSNWLQKPYINQFEDKAVEQQLEGLGDNALLLKTILKEYKERKSLESKVAKDADSLEYILSLRELELTGNLEAKRRLDSESTTDKHLYTQEAKKLRAIIMKTHPTQWTRKDMLESHNKYNLDGNNQNVLIV